jgi:AGZA family xanthine/uracil permease-like MFS transporter
MTKSEPIEIDDSDKCWLDRHFLVTRRGSTMRTEVFAGITTFLSMCYILTVNPTNLCMVGPNDPNGPVRWPSVFLATCFGSITGTLLMAFLANMPYAQAPGMGLNSAIGALVAFGDDAGNAWSYDNAMALGFLYSTIVLLVTIVPITRNRETGKWVPMREKLFDGIPPCVRNAIPVGIGLFIAMVGVKNAAMVVNDDFVLVSFVDWTKLWTKKEGDAHVAAKSAIVCLVSLVAIALLTKHQVSGGVVIGIVIGTLVGIPLGISDTNIIAGKSQATWRFWENFSNYFRWDLSRGGVFFGCFRGFKFPAGSALSVVMNVISLGMVDLFDTMGTVVGCAERAGLADDDGKPEGYGSTMYADSIASLAASMFGTSSVTTLLESGVAIAAGGKTGVVALSVAGMFVLSIFFLPVFAFIPFAAAGAALVFVGVLMMGAVRSVDFSDIALAVPAFMTIAMMPFTYSITKGIGLGMLTYILIEACDWVTKVIIYFVRRGKEPEVTLPPWNISVVTLIVGALFLVYFFVPLG